MKWKTKINHPLVLRTEGFLLLIEGLFMLAVLPVTYLHHGLYMFSMPFSALITLLTGFILLIATRKHKDDKTSSHDGVYIVCISWLVLSFFGSIPYLLSKSVPNFTDGFFEALSGFTTTGATILTRIEAVPKDILLWRSMTQWMGGFAIIVFTVAILPYLSMSGMQLFVAESTASPMTNCTHASCTPSGASGVCTCHSPYWRPSCSTSATWTFTMPCAIR